MEVKLPDVCKIQYGFPFDSAQFSSTAGIPLVRIRDVVRGYSETYTVEVCNKEYFVENGDLLVGMDGEFNIARWNGGHALLNQRVCRLIPNECINKDYLFYLMPQILKEIESQTPFATVKHLSAKQLNAISFPLPPLDEQRRIAATLDKVTNLIALRKQQLAKLDELVKARFVEMFGHITETVPLSYYISSLSAGRSLVGEGECVNKVLKTGAATYDEFDPTQVKNLPIDYTPPEEHLLQTGDVIISRMNTAELVGATAYVWEAPTNTYLPDRLWRAELKDNICPIFLWQSLVQTTTKKTIRRISSGTSGSMKNISKPELLGLSIKKVELDLQEKFSNFVEQVHKQKLTTQKELDILIILKKSLTQIFLGEFYDKAI